MIVKAQTREEQPCFLCDPKKAPVYSEPQFSHLQKGVVLVCKRL